MLTVARCPLSRWPAAELDRQRYRLRLTGAIRRQLPEIVGEEQLLRARPGETVRIPLRSAGEPCLCFDAARTEAIGQGSGCTPAGRVLGKASSEAVRSPGDRPGFDYTEEGETTLEELTALLYADLCLPFLEEREAGPPQDSGCWSEIGLSGPAARLDRRRTLLANLRRRAMAAEPLLGPLDRGDLRFRVLRENTSAANRAVIIAMMDTSGSMGALERHLARSFFFWALRLLRLKYSQVETVFLVHHVEAREVSEAEFFTRGACGGTRCSSAYRLALRLIEGRYPPQNYNLYPVHFSDGDNLPSDNQDCLALVGRLLGVCNLFVYGELAGPLGRAVTLGRLYERLGEPRLVTFTLRDRHDLYPALKKCFGAG